AMGYAACQNASDEEPPQGNVGAGKGVTVGKWAGFDGIMKGGFGAAALAIEADSGADENVLLWAAAVTNSVGDVLAADGAVLAGARSPTGGWMVEQDPLRRFPAAPPTQPGTNTTLIVVVTNARLDKVQANRLAQRAHDGLAIAVRPAHTSRDGDTAFALATGQIETPFDLVANSAVEVVVEAIRNSVRAATTVGGIPGLASSR
ncbi:MAG: P1 family peptidase, partial [Ardenticatenaceae bacterium]